MGRDTYRIVARVNDRRVSSRSGFADPKSFGLIYDVSIPFYVLGSLSNEKEPEPRRTPARSFSFSRSRLARFLSSSSFGTVSLLALRAHRAYEQPPDDRSEDEP